MDALDVLLSGSSSFNNNNNNNNSFNNWSSYHACSDLAAEQYLTATCVLIVSIIFCGPYSVCMYIIVTNKKMIKQPYYLIVANMGVSDMIQLILNGLFAGLSTYLCIDFELGGWRFWLNKSIGGLLNFCWVICCVFAHLLAFNRFISIFFSKHKAARIFSMRNTKIMLTVIWLYGLIWLIAYQYPNFDINYYLREYKWDYGTLPLSRLAWMLELISDSIQVLGMAFWYTLILLKLRAKMNEITSLEIAAERKKELRVLLQASILCVMVILNMLGFFLIGTLFDNRWANLTSNLIWLICVGNNSFIYIALNSTIRAKFVSLVTLKATNRIAPIRFNVAATVKEAPRQTKIALNQFNIGSGRSL